MSECDIKVFHKARSMLRSLQDVHFLKEETEKSEKKVRSGTGSLIDFIRLDNLMRQLKILEDFKVASTSRKPSPTRMYFPSGTGSLLEITGSWSTAAEVFKEMRWELELAQDFGLERQCHNARRAIWHLQHEVEAWLSLEDSRLHTTFDVVTLEKVVAFTIGLRLPSDEALVTLQERVEWLYGAKNWFEITTFQQALTQRLDTDSIRRKSDKERQEAAVGRGDLCTALADLFEVLSMSKTVDLSDNGPRSLASEVRPLLQQVTEQINFSLANFLVAETAVAATMAQAAAARSQATKDAELRAFALTVVADQHALAAKAAAGGLKVPLRLADFVFQPKAEGQPEAIPSTVPPPTSSGADEGSEELTMSSNTQPEGDWAARDKVWIEVRMEKARKEFDMRCIKTLLDEVATLGICDSDSEVISKGRHTLKHFQDRCNVVALMKFVEQGVQQDVVSIDSLRQYENLANQLRDLQPCFEAVTECVFNSPICSSLGLGSSCSAKASGFSECYEEVNLQETKSDRANLVLQAAMGKRFPIGEQKSRWQETLEGIADTMVDIRRLSTGPSQHRF